MELSLEKAFEKAVEFHNNNNLKQAIILYEKILNLKPNHRPSLINLGNILDLTGNLVKAKFCFEKLLSLDSQNTEIIFKLSIIFYKLNDLENSLKNFDTLIKINPNTKYLRYNLANVMRSKNILNLKKTDNELIKKLFLFLFENTDIDHSAISKNTLLFLFENEELEKFYNKKNLISEIFINKLIKEEIFQLLIQKSIITNNILERILTNIRSEIFLSRIKNNIFTLENKNFLFSLAQQCWLNEYIWFVAEDELIKLDSLKNEIENKTEINEIEIALVACYLPLNSSEIIKKKLINYKSENNYFNDLINLQIKEPDIEFELKKNINLMSGIKNKVSLKVRNQYEENPYPRWRYCNQLFSIDFNKDLNFQIRPNKLSFKNNSKKIDILLAGCGTGKHLISISKYENSKILAVDLSLTSLAYAKRKVNEFGYKNIEFLQADILDLKNLNKKFDIIESVGTLHHMQEPITGLKILIKNLKPGGLLRLGLYSEIARKEIVNLRNIINNKNLKNNINDIKFIRKFILNENRSSSLYNSIFNKDFYSTSNLRDLLFHVQEHRYSIPKIIEILKKFNLEFLGFVFSNNIIKFEYSKMFPNDKNQTNLENWNKFELKYPKTFMSMYQFWVQNK